MPDPNEETKRAKKPGSTVTNLLKSSLAEAREDEREARSSADDRTDKAFASLERQILSMEVSHKRLTQRLYWIIGILLGSVIVLSGYSLTVTPDGGVTAGQIEAHGD